MYYKWTAIGLTMLLVLACDPIQSGDPPTFTGTVQAKVLGQDQVSISWSPGSDDLLEPYELRYGIWLAESANGVNLEQGAQFITRAGAISYSLVGLDPDTEYEVVVRARDLGNQYSENTQATTFTTSAEGTGTWRTPQEIAISYEASDLIRGRVFSEARDAIGLIEGSRIHWYASGDNGFATTQTAETNIGATIMEAFLVRTDTRLYADLFVVTQNGLAFYRNTNNGNGYGQQTWSINTTPAEKSLRFYLARDILVAFSFIESGSTARIYSNDAQAQEVDDTFFDRGTRTISNPNGLFLLTNADDDNFVDLVSFGNNGLQIALGTDEDYNFETATTIDADIVLDRDIHTFFAGDADADGDDDLFIYDHDENNGTSRLHIFANQGDGTYADVDTTDYAGATYTKPLLSQANTDTNLDLTFLQTASNNIAVFFGPSTTYSQVGDYLGTDIQVDFAEWGLFDNFTGRDLVLVTTGKITALLARESTQP